MIKRNDGISKDDICQNQFTAYVVLAVKRKRQSYIKKKQREHEKETKEKIAEQQKRLRALEAQLAEEENLEIVRMVKAVKMDNKELTAFLKAYASGMISLPEGMLQEGNTENEETEGYEDEA